MPHTVLLVGVDPLCHHDGIVHQDAQHQDKGHHRHGADGNSGRREQRDGAQQGHRDTRSHPQGQAKTQEQGEHQQYQQQAAAGVLGQRVQPVDQVLGFILPDGQLNTIGQIPLRL